MLYLINDNPSSGLKFNHNNHIKFKPCHHNNHHQKNLTFEHFHVIRHSSCQHHHCSNSHRPHLKSANCLTRFATMIEFFSHFFSNLYLFGALFDTICFSKSALSPIGISYQGLSVGFIIAIYFAVGSSYCHNKLFVLNQDENNSSKYALSSDKGRLMWWQVCLLTADLGAHASDTSHNLHGLFGYTLVILFDCQFKCRCMLQYN